MKQYLLLLKSSDFTKSGNTWTSNPINLYHNSQYSNFSYTRSAYGLNLIGDRTYVGTELASPSYSEGDATPVSDTAVYVTDIGEVVYDVATPDLLRFIDTTAKVDILNYKYTFTNISGTIVPNMTLTVYESDESSGPWLRSSVSQDSGIIYISNAKPYVKFECVIDADILDLNTVGMLMYVEIGIHDPIPKTISDSVRNVAKRFPSWTAIFEDSMDPATPSLAIPESTGGKFLTALLQENLEKFNSLVEVNDINSYINSANEDMIAWVYVSYNVPQNINLISGDSVRLARVSSFTELLDGRSSDYSFFYSAIDKQLVTLRKFETLTINNFLYEQEPLNIYNDFDEFGARLGLPRLYLESNSNFKKRILDVTVNMPGVSIDAFKRTIRRELDLWRAFGATPDSNYLGATPEVLEISDIETSTPYFTESGKPEDRFKKFVEYINNRYPSNVGYVRWNEGVWDYAGKLGEGVSRIPAIYDAAASPIGEYYKQGVGDFDDLALSLYREESATTSFTGYIDVSGYVKVDETDIYPPIVVDYSWYFGYLRTVSDVTANTVGVELTYEICMPAHDNYATPSVFYANLNYNDRSDFYVTNRFLSTSNSSPEHSYINIFNNEGLSEIEFRDKIYNQLYINSSATPEANEIDIYEAASVNVIFGRSWDADTQSYTSLGAPEFRASFTSPTAAYYVNPSAGDSMTINGPDIHPNDAELKLGSTKYITKIALQSSDPIKSSIVLNNSNDLATPDVDPKKIYISDLMSAMSIPGDADPKFIYLQAATPSNLTEYGSSSIVSEQGGISYDIVSDETYLVPSSPSLIWRSNSDGMTSTPDYFNNVLIDLASTPDYIEVYSHYNNSYPFVKPIYDEFSISSTPSIYYGFIDEIGNAHKNESEYTNSFIVNDTFLSQIDLSRDSFSGIDENYTIDTIKFISDPDYIEAYVVDIDSTISDLNSAVANDLSLTLDINARRDDIKKNKYGIGMNSGFLFMGEKEFYVYSSPITETYNGRLFEITLNQVPRMGSPVIVKIDGEDLREIAFEDSATPGKFSFENTETVTGNRGNSLFLAYENISDATIVDTYTGVSLFSGLSSLTNIITPFSAATPSVVSREYEVTYYVNDAFYVDKDVYNSSSDNYESIIYFSSTPSVASDYEIIYESSRYNKSIDSELTINQLDSPVNEGFIFIDENVSPFDTVEYHLSPGYINDSGGDFMTLSIISYDENGNFKPNQTFSISSTIVDVVSNSDLVTVNVDGSAYATTNDNGFVAVALKYAGSYPSVERTGTVSITGLDSSNPNANANSECSSYSETVSFEIIRNLSFNLEVKASPVNMTVSADGITDIVIVGRVYWRNIPLKQVINLGWNKARTLYDLFQAPASNIVTTDSDGYFVISGQITAEPNTNPGQWFARIEITDSAEDIKLLLPAGEVTEAEDITISGDIVYWNEKYDNVHFVNEELPLSNIFTHEKQDGSELIATPNFVYSHHDSLTVSNIAATPNWTPSKWVALNRFDQYQMGLFGSTPNYISDYTQIHPDCGEE